MNLDVLDGRFREVVGADVEIVRLATGFGFTEGPIWHNLERHESKDGCYKSWHDRHRSVGNISLKTQDRNSRYLINTIGLQKGCDEIRNA